VLPNALVTDAEVIQGHYLARYGAPSTVIRYGVEAQPLPPTGVVPELGLTPRRYFLYVSRFEPENNPHQVAAAYRAVGGDLPLVMVGGAPYASRFIRSFTAGADARILFPGPVYGDGYRELLSHALASIHATEVGGTHPALVEAMGYGNCCLVNDTPENREVAGAAALYFDAQRPPSLSRLLNRLLADPGEARRRGRRAARRARRRFSWEGVTQRYAELFKQLAGR
jgi:glycosyltransferase involved in cell wall biosynthesis